MQSTEVSARNPSRQGVGVKVVSRTVTKDVTAVSVRRLRGISGYVMSRLLSNTLTAAIFVTCREWHFPDVIGTTIVDTSSLWGSVAV